jgi:sugar O-acyltransferase (sialic acid O-acetyltransferase NeuD family)
MNASTPLASHGEARSGNRIVIAGAGGFGLAVAEALEVAGLWRIVGLVDDRWPEMSSAGCWPVLGASNCLSDLRLLADAVVVAIGHNTAREALFEQARAAGFALPTVVHPHAYISKGAEIGAGAIVMAGAVVSHGCRVGEGALLNAGAILDHDSQVERFAHVGIAASLGGGARLTARAMLPQGEFIPQNGVRIRAP